MGRELAKKLEIKAVIRAIDKATAPVRLAARRIKIALGNSLRGVGRIGLSVGKVIGGLAVKAGALGAAGVGGLAAWAKSYVSAGNEISKFSRQVGFTAQRMQEYELVAKRASVGSDEFRDAIKDMSERVGEAKGEMGGELYEGLKNLDKGLLKAVMSTDTAEQAFELLIRAVERETDATKRNRLANIAFGEAGFAMIRMAEKGQVELGRLTKVVRESGAVMDGKALKASEKATERWHEFSEQITATRNTIMGELLPVFLPLIKRMSDWLKVSANQKQLAAWVRQFVQAVIDGVPRVITWFKEAGEWVANLIDKMGGLKGVGLALAGLFAGKLLFALGPVGVALAGIAAAAVYAYQKIKEVIEANDKINKRDAKAGLAAIEAATLNKPVKLEDGSVQAKGPDLALFTLANLRSGGVGERDTSALLEASRRMAANTSQSEFKGQLTVDLRSKDPNVSIDGIRLRGNGALDLKAKGARKSQVGR